MSSLTRSVRMLLLGLAASVVVFLTPSISIADQIVTKDGKVYDCEIVSEETDYYVIKVKGESEPRIIDKADVKSVERTKKEEAKPAEKAKPGETPAQPKTDTKPASGAIPPAPGIGGKKPATGKHVPAVTGVSRVAILHFGGPSSWGGKYGDTVGVQVNAQSWRDAMPHLEKDKVDVVVVRINSGGGALAELVKFHDVFEEYKKKWRTVTWVESAISAACMSPWVIEEWYFLPEGNAGSNTGWSGQYQFMGGTQLLEVLYMMEKVSEKGRHPKEMMRSMQIPDALSCNIDENNNITWFQTDSGKYVVNPAGKILCLNANDALKYGLSRGTAATKEELVKVMGLNEVEWVGSAAAAVIENSMKKYDAMEKEFDVNARKYEVAIRAAMALQGPENREARLKEVGVAKRHFNKLKELAKGAPNLARNMNPAWWQQQEDLIKELSR